MVAFQSGFGSSFDGMTTPLVVAHRGASKAERENTIQAFRTAKTLGAFMVELDVRRSADGAMVVHHDPTIGDRLIKGMRTDELPEYVPNLADSLDACEGLEVNIEIKNDVSEPDHDATCSLADDVVELLRTRGDGDRMLISSFDLATIDRVRVLAPDLRTGYLFMYPTSDVHELLQNVAAKGHVAIHPYRKVTIKGLVDEAHANGLAVNVWTVDDPEEMKRLAGLGVDAIITNVPDIANATLTPSA
jgi:glycerophosphoryl diester phosphodiesterase